MENVKKVIEPPQYDFPNLRGRPRREGTKVFLLDPSTMVSTYGAGRIYRITRIIFLYLKFPEEISNEQSATPKRETLVGARWRGRDGGDVGTLSLYFGYFSA